MSLVPKMIFQPQLGSYATNTLLRTTEAVLRVRAIVIGPWIRGIICFSFFYKRKMEVLSSLTATTKAGRLDYRGSLDATELIYCAIYSKLILDAIKKRT